ncbi:tetratricopeptide repeat protein [Myroides sp. M-43]|uniref:tetratricopeptide repeat protein n=1 Tax=Myroides oncorhynchi TaxID=2893756 RepID=UPI001E3E7C18|nr:tetratricopeptide repeat protein [Myroides oncorhynchi]MCC9042812.1 tetratricopeptide repeat protein [Myroides oncorhynchi]
MNKRNLKSLLAIALISVSGFAQDLETAKKAIQDEQYDKAKAILKSLVESKPNDGINYYYLGDVLLQEEEVESARTYFEKGIGVKGKGFLNYIGLGQLALDDNNVNLAKENFDKALKSIRKKDYNEQLLVASAYLNSKHSQPKEAIAIAQAVITADYTNASAYNVLGKAYLADENFNEAFSAFRNAISYDETLLDAKLQLAIITKRGRGFAEAIKACEEILVVNPNYAPALREIADSYYLWSLSDAVKKDAYVSKADEYYQKYLVASGNSVESRMKYADFLLVTGDYIKLEKEATSLSKEEGVNNRINRYLGYAGYHNANYTVAIEGLEKYLTKAKKVIGRDHLYLGLSYLNTAKDNNGHYAKGVEQLQKAVKVEPAVAEEFHSIGLDLSKKGNLKEAIDVFSVSADIKSQSNYTYDNYYAAYCYYLLGRDDESGNNEGVLNQADKYFERAIQADSKLAEAYFFKARANRLQKGDDAYKKMFDSYNSYVRVIGDAGDLGKTENKDRLVEAYTSIATYHANKQENNEAIVMFNKVLELDSQNEFAKSTLKALEK